MFSLGSCIHSYPDTLSLTWSVLSLKQSFIPRYPITHMESVFPGKVIHTQVTHHPHKACYPWSSHSNLGTPHPHRYPWDCCSHSYPITPYHPLRVHSLYKMVTQPPTDNKGFSYARFQTQDTHGRPLMKLFLEQWICRTEMKETVRGKHNTGYSTTTWLVRERPLSTHIPYRGELRIMSTYQMRLTTYTGVPLEGS